MLSIQSIMWLLSGKSPRHQLANIRHLLFQERDHRCSALAAKTFQFHSTKSDCVGIECNCRASASIHQSQHFSRKRQSRSVPLQNTYRIYLVSTEYRPLSTPHWPRIRKAILKPQMALANYFRPFFSYGLSEMIFDFPEEAHPSARGNLMIDLILTEERMNADSYMICSIDEGRKIKYLVCP